MAEDPEDIYDVVMTTQETTSGFGNLRARFEAQSSSTSTPPKPPKSLKDKIAAFQNESEPNGVPKQKPTPPSKPGVPIKPSVKPTFKDKPSPKQPPFVAPKTLKTDKPDGKPQVVSPKNIASMFENKIQNDANNNSDNKQTPLPKKPVGKLASQSFLHKLESVTGGGVKTTDTDGATQKSTINKESKPRNSLQRKETLDVPLGLNKPIVKVRKISQVEDVVVENTELGDIVMDKAGVKYKEWPLPMANNGEEPPDKPRKKPPIVDLSEFYPGEVYDDIVAPQAAPAPAPARPVSYIPVYDSDEEEEDTKIPPITEETYDDTMNGPTDVYDDGVSSNVVVEQPDDNIYEAYDDIVVDSPPSQPAVPTPPRPGKPTIDPKKEKELKKEQKKKEEERKKREEEEKKMKKLFKMDGTETCIYISTMLMDVKQTRTDLGAAQGEPLEIIRLVGNPAGKWLCRNNYGKVGYVESNKIKPPDGKIEPNFSQSDETYDDVDADQEVYECIDVP